MTTNTAPPHYRCVLQVVILREFWNLASYFVDEGADVHLLDCAGMTPLMFLIQTTMRKKRATKNEENASDMALRLDFMERLIDAGADVNFNLGGRVTPMEIAVELGSVRRRNC